MNSPNYQYINKVSIFMNFHIKEGKKNSPYYIDSMKPQYKSRDVLFEVIAINKTVS